MKHIIILITSIWLLAGCEDLLEMEPKNSLTYASDYQDLYDDAL